MTLQLNTSLTVIIIAIFVFYQTEVIQSCLFRTSQLTKPYEVNEVGNEIDSSVLEEYDDTQDRPKRDADELQPNFEIDYDSESFIRASRRILNETKGGNATYKVMINGSEVERPRPMKMLNVEYYAAKKKFFETPAQNGTNATSGAAAPGADPAGPPPEPAAEPPTDK